ncbi:hypothetical protein OQA88_3514 [Cercophora sp. LCS_1]
MATTGEFRYLDPTSQAPGTKPWAKVDTSAAQSYSQTTRRRSVTDIRSLPPSSFGTDISGFSLHHAPAKETAFTDDAAIRTGYYAEVESLLKAQLPGVKKVVIFDHTIRKHDPSAPRQPVQSVHVDQTPGAAEVRVRRHVEGGAEAEELLKGRYQIINVWRPISHPATDFPLALVDWRTTEPEDLIAVDLLYPIPRGEGEKEVLPDPEKVASTEGYEIKGETYGVGPSERHKFYYVRDMKPEEALFIKCFDSWGEWHSGKEGVAVLTPHTAFVDPQTPHGTKGRESIEVRCLVFYE